MSWMQLSTTRCYAVLTLLVSVVSDSPSGRDGRTALNKTDPEVGSVRVRHCEPQHVDLCRGLGYNVTGWPNIVGHHSLHDAELQLRTFTPLLQYGCGSDGELRFFLCAVYLPMCTEKVPDVIGPCRTVCERVRRLCEPILHLYGFPWPSTLNCSRFPARNDHSHMCMEGPFWAGETDVVESEHTNQKATAATATAAVIQLAQPCPILGTTSVSRPRDGYRNETGQQRPCVMVYKTFVNVWLMVFSAIGVASTVFTVLTYIIDVRRYTYIERVVIIMSTCSGLCAVTYLISLIAGGTPTGGLTSTRPVNSDCTVVFVLLYYFSSACVIWWLILDVIWMLMTGFRWTDEAVRRLTTWFHLVGWTLPAVATIIILVRNDVELDEISGLCRVATGRPVALGLVLIPSAVYLVLGVSFLLVGSVQCRRHRQRDDKKTGLEKDGDRQRKATVASNSEEDISVRTGIVALIGGVVLVSWTVSFYHEFLHSDPDKQSTAAVPGTLIKLLSSLVIGLVSGPWLLLSGLAVEAWKKFFLRQRRRHFGKHQHVVDIHATPAFIEGLAKRQWRPLLNGNDLNLSVDLNASEFASVHAAKRHNGQNYSNGFISCDVCQRQHCVKQYVI